MATIEAKLNYLYSVKQAISRAIAEKGVAVSETDTFYSYANKIRRIAGQEITIKPEFTPEDSLTVTFVEAYNSNNTDSLELPSISLTASGTLSESVSIDYNNAFAQYINKETMYRYDFDNVWVEFAEAGVMLKQRTIALEAGMDTVDGTDIAYLPVPIGEEYNSGVVSMTFKWEWE